MLRTTVLWLLIGCAAPATPLFAQTAAEATVRGVVVDPMNAPIAGAEVSVVARVTPPVTARTDQDGRFQFILPEGSYTVSVTAPGFATVQQPLALRRGETITPRFALPLQHLTEAINVTSSRGYRTSATSSATRTEAALIDIPQSISVVTDTLIRDQLMTSVADAMRYVPGVTTHQGENNRDQVIVRGNSSSADFFINGVRDDVQYYRDLYNLDRIEVLKGPNALTFGRGGAGGVVNRVVKEAGFQPLREVLFQGGQFGNKRINVDVGQPAGARVALRLNGMYEDSNSFRDGVEFERGAINPTLTFVPDDRTRITVGYEYLRDHRGADRGITSVAGRPADVARQTYFGDAQHTYVRADVTIASVGVTRTFGRLRLRNRTQVADYARAYQNFVPGAATADATLVTLTAYNNATDRKNVFSQADISMSGRTGVVEHTLLAGAEIGHQVTNNLRQSGFFNGTATSVQVPLAEPRTTLPVIFRQNATDADNDVRTLVGAAFIQDQVKLTPKLYVLGGVRFDRFNLEYHNNRNGDTLTRPDNLISPRAGIVVKPLRSVSLYGSYSVSYLPSSGDQFASLTTITQQIEPEKFANYEIGTKWETPSGLALTAAVYRLDRTNTRSTDPSDPTKIVQTGAQRTEGFEIAATGTVVRSWVVAGGYAYQDARVRRATASARAGALSPQVPRHSFSLWNTIQLHSRVSAGIGLIQRSDVFAAIDNTVLLPGYLRADAAAYLSITPRTRLQLNVENLTDRTYYVNADSNTNISPGVPRAVRIALITRF